MAVFKRGTVYWYKFKFAGVQIRESTRSGNLEVARRAERERRRALELGANHLEPIRKPLMFKTAAAAWLSETPSWADSTREINTLKVRHLLPSFGGMLISDIGARDIAAHQRARQRAGAAPRTINMEVSALRQILRAHGRWALLEGQVKMLREPEEIGRALSDDEMHRIYAAAGASRSRSLKVALRLFECTGLRLNELRTMRWRQAVLVSRSGVPAGLTTGKGKTKGGEGRFVPLNDDALAELLAWRARFPNAQPEHFIFPTERYGLLGDQGMRDGSVAVWNVNPEKPIGSWKTAWTTCRAAAGVKCRTHDLRHTFVSRLAEGGTPDATLMALTGHMSRRMLERYSHTRTQAKLDAVQMLNRPRPGVGTEEGTVQ